MGIASPWSRRRCSRNPQARSVSSKRSMKGACPGRILTRASASVNHAARSTSGKDCRRPLRDGHSSSKRFDFKRAGSKPPRGAKAVMIFRLGCLISPRSNGRLAAVGCRALLRTHAWRRREDPRPLHIRLWESTRRQDPSSPRTDRRDVPAAAQAKSLRRDTARCRRSVSSSPEAKRKKAAAGSIRGGL